MPKSQARTFPLAASRCSSNPPPPIPLIQGSTTPNAREVTTTASTALPPAASTAAPACAARRFWDTTMPPSETMAGLRMTWRRERLSTMTAPGGLEVAVRDVQARTHRSPRKGKRAKPPISVVLSAAKQPCFGRLSSVRWIPLLVVPEHGIHAGKELTHDRDDRHLLLLPFGQQVLVVGGESWIVSTGGKGRHEKEATEPGPAALDPAFAAAVG